MPSLRETGTWETDHLRPRGPKFLEFYEEYFCNLLNIWDLGGFTPGGTSQLGYQVEKWADGLMECWNIELPKRKSVTFGSGALALWSRLAATPRGKLEDH
jgi:hypothetical protein